MSKILVGAFALVVGLVIGVLVTKRLCVDKVKTAVSDGIVSIGLDPNSGVGAKISSFANQKIDEDNSW